MDVPIATDLLAHPAVIAAFAAAWADSLPDDPALRHEEGGFIYVNAASGDITVRRATPGRRRDLNLSQPPELSGWFLCATYHTHPNPVALGWDPQPSAEDRREADLSGVPWFVVTELEVFVVGPDRRVGGLTGPPTYPI
jgi:hypothetical protein